MAHTSLLNHRKTRRLTKLLVMPKPHVIGHLDCLWLTAYEDISINRDGLLIGWTADDIESVSEWSGEDGLWVSSLVQTGFFDELVDGDGQTVYAIHNYATRAPKYIQERWRKRERATTALVTGVSGQLVPTSGQLVPTSGQLVPTSGQKLPSTQRNATQSKATQSNAFSSSPPASAGEQAKPKPKTPPKPPPPYPAWDAICTEFGFAPVTQTEKKRTGRLASDLRAKCEARSPPLDPSEFIRLVKSAYTAHFPGAAWTPDAMLKHADMVLSQKPVDDNPARIRSGPGDENKTTFRIYEC